MKLKDKHPELPVLENGFPNWKAIFRPENIGVTFICNRSLCKNVSNRASGYSYWVMTRRIGKLKAGGNDYAVKIGGQGKRPPIDEAYCAAKAQEIAVAEAQDKNMRDKEIRAEERIRFFTNAIALCDDYEEKQRLRAILKLWQLDLDGVRKRMEGNTQFAK